MNPAPPVTSSRSNGRALVAMSADGPGDGSGQPAGGIVGRGHLGRTEKRRHGSGVGPMTVVDRAVETPVGDVVIEDVGDLQLATTRRQQVVDDRERVRSQE